MKRITLPEVSYTCLGTESNAIIAEWHLNRGEGHFNTFVWQLVDSTLGGAGTATIEFAGSSKPSADFVGGWDRTVLTLYTMAAQQSTASVNNRALSNDHGAWTVFPKGANNVFLPITLPYVFLLMDGTATRTGPITYAVTMGQR